MDYSLGKSLVSPIPVNKTSTAAQKGHDLHENSSFGEQLTFWSVYLLQLPRCNQQERIYAAI